MPIGPFMKAALPVIGNVVGNLMGAGIQSTANMRLAKYQNEYNSPVNQMKRFKEAGLNPNLMYSQGNAGNMTPITPTNWQGVFSNVGSQYVQSELGQTQADVGQQKIIESQAKTEIAKVQEKILQANPYLRPEYLNGVVNIMWNTAKLKQQEADFYLGDTTTAASTAGNAKMQLDLNNLAERNNLQVADKEIKAQILRSEKFKAELLSIQEKWLKEGDITPQHIFQGIMLLLTKFM